MFSNFFLFVPLYNVIFLRLSYYKYKYKYKSNNKGQKEAKYK